MNTPNTRGLDAHPAGTAASMPIVQGRCPACGHRSLFLAVGGYVTCSIVRCKEPDAASRVLEADR